MSKELQSAYEKWKNIEDEIKHLRQAQTEALKEFADTMNVKKGDIAKAFRVKRRLEEKQENEIDIISSIFDSLH